MPFSFKKAKAFHLRQGAKGEEFTRRLLSLKHYEILTSNYRCPKGEIDIVARDGATLVFVEVKTKSSRSKGRPGDNLSLRQRARIYRAALSYLKKIGDPPLTFRFDMVEVSMGRSEPLGIWHWRAAFGKEMIARQRGFRFEKQR